MTALCRSSAVCLGLALSLAGVARAAPSLETIETKHLTVAISAPPAAVAPGGRVSLTLEVTPRSTMHVYAPGQKDYIAISLAIQPDPAVTAGAARFPPPEKLLLKALGETQLVYRRPFRIAQDVTVARTAAIRARARTPGATVAVTGTLRYQACDDIICYVPVDVPVVWTIALKPSEGATP